MVGKNDARNCLKFLFYFFSSFVLVPSLVVSSFSFSFSFVFSFLFTHPSRVLTPNGSSPGSRAHWRRHRAAMAGNQIAPTMRPQQVSMWSRPCMPEDHHCLPGRRWTCSSCRCRHGSHGLRRRSCCGTRTLCTRPREPPRETKVTNCYY